MRMRLTFLCLVCLLAAGCAPTVNVAQEESALMDADRAWAQTATDLDQFMSFLTPDASVFAPGAPIASSPDAIRAMMSEMMAMPGFSVTWEPAKAVVSAAGDLGYTHGTYEMTFSDSAGAPVTERGKYVTVWKKQTDGWKVFADIFNSDAPPMPAQ